MKKLIYERIHISESKEMRTLLKPKKLEKDTIKKKKEKKDKTQRDNKPNFVTDRRYQVFRLDLGLVSSILE